MMRCTPEELAALKRLATEAGLAVAPFLRTLAFGRSGPRAVRRPPVERAELARLLAEFGKLGSNVNQLARVANTTGQIPGAATLAGIAEQVRELRGAVMQALGRGD